MKAEITAVLSAPATQNYKKQEAEQGSHNLQKGYREKEVKQDAYVPSDDVDAGEEVTYARNGALVEQLKAEQVEIQARFLHTVQETLAKQGREIAIGEGIWKFLASGEYTVDAETQAAAKEAISEDGYWGVKQTSERIVSFAKALVGGDPSRVEEMRAAFIKGFEAATEAWGGTLPEITSRTYDAVMALFDEWAATAE